jgi:hypothetical protein
MEPVKWSAILTAASGTHGCSYERLAASRKAVWLIVFRSGTKLHQKALRRLDGVPKNRCSHTLIRTAEITGRMEVNCKQQKMMEPSARIELATCRLRMVTSLSAQDGHKSGTLPGWQGCDEPVYRFPFWLNTKRDRYTSACSVDSTWI